MRSRPQRPLVRVLVPALLAAAAVALAGCNERAVQKKPVDVERLPAGLTPEQAARVLAKVGDEVITLGDFAATLERMDSFDRLRYQSAERRKELLDEMIDVELLAQDAKAKGLDKEPETQAAIHQILREALLAEVHRGARAPADIPAEEVRAFYEAHLDEFREPERRRVGQIALASAEAAEKVLAQAKVATPMQWGELVQKHSLDKPPKPSPTNPLELSGDVGIVGAPGDPKGANPRVPEEVRAAVFDIAEVGQVLDRVVASGGRFYVVKMMGRTEARERSLAEADRSIRVAILQADVEKREKALEDQLRKEFPVTIDDKALKGVKLPAAQAEEGEGAGTSAAGEKR